MQPFASVVHEKLAVEFENNAEIGVRLWRLEGIVEPDDILGQLVENTASQEIFWQNPVLVLITADAELYKIDHAAILEIQKTIRILNGLHPEAAATKAASVCTLELQKFLIERFLSLGESEKTFRKNHKNFDKLEAASAWLNRDLSSLKMD